MYIKIRNVINHGIPDLIVDIKKNTTINDITTHILKKWDIPICKQRLIYKGKQLHPKCQVVDYDIQVNDVIQLTIKHDVVDNKPLSKSLVDVDSKFYLSDGTMSIEAKCHSYYCWCMGTIVDIKMEEGKELTPTMSLEEIEQEFIFYVKFEGQEFVHVVNFNDLRPRSDRMLKLKEIKVSDIVSVNFSFVPGAGRNAGHWYDLHISELDFVNKIITGTMLVEENLKIPGVRIKYENGIVYKIKKRRLLQPVLKDDPFPDRINETEELCLFCKNKKTKKCLLCGCSACGSKKGFSDAILCNECFGFYHYYCAGEQLLPREREWYCPRCKNIPDIVLAGEAPKRKLSGASAKAWGRGMACVGRSKQCTIVPMHHFGPIPGVEVGMRWKFRIQVSEAGVHRPPVYGIHGRENVGAFSIVFSGGYEDDVDNGKEFIYSGSGGKDMSNNRRTGGAQNKDQALTRNNKALAMNCNAKFNAVKGATSRDWKKGKPVRVCRSFKLKKISKYAPDDGVRYDGIYKVVKYYKEAGKSGFMFWKFLLRRDDPTPAPWEKEGQEFDVIYPDGYLEAKRAKLDISEKDLMEAGPSQPDKLKNGTEKEEKPKNVPKVGPTEKGKGKSTKKSFKLDPDIEKLIKSDQINDSLWDECLETVKLGKFSFTQKVQEVFKCIVCQEVVYNPVTPCAKHNICWICLERSFEANLYNCPYCRRYLGPKFIPLINEKLSETLKSLLPGYDQNRE